MDISERIPLLEINEGQNLELGNVLTTITCPSQKKVMEYIDNFLKEMDTPRQLTCFTHANPKDYGFRILIQRNTDRLSTTKKTTLQVTKVKKLLLPKKDNTDLKYKALWVDQAPKMEHGDPIKHADKKAFKANFSHADSFFPPQNTYQICYRLTSVLPYGSKLNDKICKQIEENIKLQNDLNALKPSFSSIVQKNTFRENTFENLYDIAYAFYKFSSSQETPRQLICFTTQKNCGFKVLKYNKNEILNNVKTIFIKLPVKEWDYKTGFWNFIKVEDVYTKHTYVWLNGNEPIIKEEEVKDTKAFDPNFSENDLNLCATSDKCCLFISILPKIATKKIHKVTCLEISAKYQIDRNNAPRQ